MGDEDDDIEGSFYMSLQGVSLQSQLLFDIYISSSEYSNIITQKWYEKDTSLHKSMGL